jgi:hypothetical protein
MNPLRSAEAGKSDSGPSIARRRRPSSAKARLEGTIHEVRGTVTYSTCKHLDTEADALGRSRSWHVGLIVEGWVKAVQGMSRLDQARLDQALREPAQLREFLHSALRKADASTAT